MARPRHASMFHDPYNRERTYGRFKLIGIATKNTNRGIWSSKSRHLALVMLMACACIGCGGSSDRARVSGTLLRSDGTPLANANVVAQAADGGKTANASTDAGGHFDLGNGPNGSGILPGNYNVFIVEDLGDRDQRRKRTIAEKYADPTKSGISLSVKAGDASEINLTLDPP